MVDKQTLQAYWNENKKLTAFTLIIWFIVTYVAAFFVNELNSIVIFGFPLGYYMGAQGSLIVFVWLIFNYAFKMNKLDKKYGVEEEEE
jgi:putative solute:sodium symporter small subunit